MDYDQALKFLKNSMMYQMSLGSKELFHSNVWAWLIENDHAFAGAFGFDREIISQIDSVEREKGNRDIVIFFKDENGVRKHVTIENKIKSLPEIEQLIKYSEEIDKAEFAGGVLTGITIGSLDINDPSLKGDWRFVDYKTIASKIYLIARQSKAEFILKNLQFIEEYVQIIDALNTLVSHLLSQSEGALNYDCSDLSSIRFADAYRKFKGSDFINYAIKNRDKLDLYCPDNYKLEINQGFNHGYPTLDIRYENHEDPSLPFAGLGVSIEGYEFRLSTMRFYKKEKNKKDANKLYKDACKLGWLDKKYSDKHKFIFGKSTKMSPRDNKKYDVYLNKSHCHVYQYFDIDENIKYEDLFALVDEFLQKAADVLTKSLTS